MKIVTHRCKFCNKEYSYIMSGSGCTEEYNNSDYCPDCMRVIMNALTGPRDKAYEYHFSEFDKIDESDISETVKEKMVSVKNSTISVYEGFFNHNVQMVPFDYKNIEIYVVDGVTYYKCWNYLSEIVYFVKNEYVVEIPANTDKSSVDISKNKKYIGRYVENKNDSFMFGQSISLRFDADKIKTINLPEPTAKLLFIDTIRKV